MSSTVRLFALILLTIPMGTFAQQKPSVIDDADHPLVQKTFISVPGYDETSKKELNNFGPSLSQTYIDAPDVRSRKLHFAYSNAPKRHHAGLAQT